jgi:glucose 1-dehydrogenase
MRALTVVPGRAGSAAVIDAPEPARGDGELLVDAVALGICGTDREIARGDYGWAPPGHDRLVLGHESLGRVREAPDGSGFAAGDLVVGVVRRPDPVPCPACAHGEFDMCRNGEYTERGIKAIDGYGSERWTVEADYAIRLDAGLGAVGVLLEPTTVVTKAWDQVDRIGARAWFQPRRALVTGAGPIGLLAGLLAVERGLELHVLDQVADGPKPELVEALGGTYHHAGLERAVAAARPDVIVEATGAAPLVFEAMDAIAAGGIVCLTGVSPRGRTLTVDAGSLNQRIVLENNVVFGTVNANLRHYRLAAEALARADHGWLERLITRRVPLERFVDALAVRPEDIKVVVDLAA